ncbi:hypothetical protein [Natrinema salsiterrestre]|uniref:Uncharacterized protein n=1 Tax=Natrinema salsiterrestre TaxID=2950540 RepID=A0A9Q4L4C5_9EURY|nr:hypothetical protein [Natrinema salsiterrestre]MDF9745700.1 hypothetical protein [Natrinema salsiterrestre]
MSAPDDRVPSTTRWGIALAALVGTVALAVHDPMVAPAALVGTGVAATIGLFAGPHRRISAAAMLLPTVVLGGVAVVGLGGGPIRALTSAVGILVASVTCSVVRGRPTPSALRRTGEAALCSAVVAGGAALLAFGIDALSGPAPMIDAILWLTGEGVSGLLVGLVVTIAAIACALLFVPLAAVTVPSRGDSAHKARNALLLAAGIAISIVVAIAVLTVLSPLIALFEPVLEPIAASTFVRGLLTIATGSAVAVAVLALVVRKSWLETDGYRNPTVPIVVGSVLGITLPFVGVTGVGSFDPAVVAALFAAAAVVLGVGWLAAWLYEGAVVRGEAPGPELVLAAGLAGGSIVAGASVETVALERETIRAGTATFVALAAALFTYDVGRYGRTLATEVGADASRRPQVVRLGWSGTVAVVGIPIAILGLAGAAVLAPTLSVPATAGVIVAVTATVGGTWLLFR